MKGKGETEIVEVRLCPSCGSLNRQRTVDDRFDMGSRLAAFNDPASKDFAWLKRKWGDEGKEAPRFAYSTCRDCGLVHTEAYPDDAALSGLYAGLSDNMEMVQPGARQRTQFEYSKKIKARGPLKAKYLEIGPDTGLFVKEAISGLVSSGTQFSGFAFLEPNVSAHKALCGLDLPAPIEVSSSLSLAQVDGPFSVAVLIHVLDHLSRPQNLLREISAKMVDGGQIVIVTHNQRSAIARAMGKSWPGYHAQHPQLYSKATLARSLTAAGFADVKVTNTKNWINLGALFSMLTQTIGFGPRSLGALGRLELGIGLGNMIAVANRG